MGTLLYLPRCKAFFDGAIWAPENNALIGRNWITSLRICNGFPVGELNTGGTNAKFYDRNFIYVLHPCDTRDGA